MAAIVAKNRKEKQIKFFKYCKEPMLLPSYNGTMHI
jgi:hypothetical protein